MSRVSNALKMLILMRANGRMKTADIAEVLEVDERMIRNYKKDLEMAGIYIESKPGIYGGYSLPEQYSCLLDLNFSKDEIISMDMARIQLQEEKFIYMKEFISIYNKIIASNKIKNSKIMEPGAEYYFGSKTTSVSGSLKKEHEFCKVIYSAIIQKNKIYIKYYSLSRDEFSERKVDPYSLYEYNGALYLLAYCEMRSDYRDFKLSRIEEIKITEEKFQPDKNFNLKEYMNQCLGIFKDKPQKIKLKITHPLSQIIKEKIWSENQNITDIPEEKAIIFEACFQGEVEIISWILSMGSHVEVIEPKNLKEKVKKEIKKMIGNF